MVTEVQPRNGDDGENGGSRTPPWRNSMPKVMIINWLVWIAPCQTKCGAKAWMYTASMISLSTAFHTRIVATRTISARCSICWRSTTLEQRMWFMNPTSSSRDHRKTGSLWCSDYIAAVRAQAGRCNFNALKNRLIRDRIVCGICDKWDLQRSFLEDSKLTLEKCVEKCKAAEQAKKLLQILTDRRRKASSRMCSLLGKQRGTNDSHTLGIDSIFTMAQSGARSVGSSARSCSFCGLIHAYGPQRCQAKGKLCNRCGKPDHFAIVCREKVWTSRKAVGILDGGWSKQSTSTWCRWGNTINGPVCRDTEKAFCGCERRRKAHVFADRHWGDLLCVEEGRCATWCCHSKRSQTCILDLVLRINSQYTGVVFHGYSNTVWEDSVRPEVPSGCRWEFIFAWCASCATARVNLHKQRGLQLKPELFCGPWNDTRTGRVHQQVSKGLRRTSWTVPRKSSPVCRSNVQPSHMSTRRFPIAIKDRLEKELERLERLDVIEATSEPSEWTSALAVTHKQNGDLRVCIDPRGLNKALQRVQHPVPTVEELVAEVANAKVFSKCDVLNGFWHVELDDESSRLTTFSTPFGRYRWKRMPFGIAQHQNSFSANLSSSSVKEWLE